jgi:hypothetical protein
MPSGNSSPGTAQSPDWRSTELSSYRIRLEQRRYAPATINLRLAAVRRIACEAADAGSSAPGRLYDRLSARYGRASVFMDIDTIPFLKELEQGES